MPSSPFTLVKPQPTGLNPSILCRWHTAMFLHLELNFASVVLPPQQEPQNLPPHTLKHGILNSKDTCSSGGEPLVATVQAQGFWSSTSLAVQMKGKTKF